MSGISPEEPFHVFIRVPSKRPVGFVDPPQILWTEAMEQQLWQLLSRHKRQSLDWNLISRQMNVPVPYLIRHATFLYETQLRGLQEQLRLGEAHSRSNSSSRPGSVMGSNDTSMQRTHSDNTPQRSGSDGGRQPRPLATPAGGERSRRDASFDSKRLSIGSSGSGAGAQSRTSLQGDQGSMSHSKISTTSKNSGITSPLNSYSRPARGQINVLGIPFASTNISPTHSTGVTITTSQTFPRNRAKPSPFSRSQPPRFSSGTSPTQKASFGTNSLLLSMNENPFTASVNTRYSDDEDEDDEDEMRDDEDQEFGSLGLGLRRRDSYEDGFKQLRLEEEEEPAFLPVQRERTATKKGGTGATEGEMNVNAQLAAAAAHINLLDTRSLNPLRTESPKATSAQNSTGSSFSDLSDTSVTESAMADALLSNFNSSKLSIFSKKS